MTLGLAYEPQELLRATSTRAAKERHPFVSARGATCLQERRPPGTSREACFLLRLLPQRASDAPAHAAAARPPAARTSGPRATGNAAAHQDSRDAESPISSCPASSSRPER